MRIYKPQNYSFEDAAHLLRRAGFGGRSEEVEQLRALGPELAVEQLLRFDDNDATQTNPFDIKAALDKSNTKNVGPGLRALQAWWLYKMIYSQQPLKEKLSLFWHGHFVSGVDKVRQPFDMQQQNQLFRKMGIGKFADLVLAVAKDPAMLRYLDNNQNKKGHPNENFARELMELFCLGVGNYSEKDVQESARAFSGWTFKNDDKASPSEFIFKRQDHDVGTKTILGQTGNFEGQDVVRIVTEQPATAQHVLRKIWAFFVNEEIKNSTLQALEGLWQKTGGDIREILRSIFTSAEFYAPENRYSLIKSPIEYVVGTLRTLQSQLEPGHVVALLNQLDGMYQVPLAPPNVSGWFTGAGWISDTSILLRLNFVAQMVNNKLGGAGKNYPVSGEPKFQWMDVDPNQDAVERLFLEFYGQRPTAQQKEIFLRLVEKSVLKNPNAAQKNLRYLILANPQYHLA